MQSFNRTIILTNFISQSGHFPIIKGQVTKNKNKGSRLAFSHVGVLLFSRMASTTTQVAASAARQAARAALHKTRPSPTAALAKPVKAQEKLAKTLEWLNKEPKPIVEKIRSLELTYAYKNDHFGARYVFVCVCGTCAQKRSTTG